MRIFGVFLFVTIFSTGLFAQQRNTSTPKLPALPDNMDCDKLKGDTRVPPNSSTTIVKRGADYYVCRPKKDATLVSARTAAIVARSTQTISCGDGSGSDCIKEDRATELQIESLAGKSDLWRYFDKAAPSNADLILQFIANERATTSSPVVLQVQDSDSGAWVYYELRPTTDIENDVNRLIDHFLLRSGRAPVRSKEEMARERQCAAIAEQLNALNSEYEAKRRAYDFKNTHLLDAQMDECNLHWKEWVCLKRGGSDGLVSYAEQWNESVQELQRKLKLEYGELKELEQQISVLSQRVCP